MAKLNIRRRKELRAKTLEIDLSEMNRGVITYYPLSKEINDIYNELRKELEKLTIDNMMKRMNIANKKSFNGDIQKKFMKEFGIEKLIEVTTETAKDFEMTCKFFHAISGVPQRDEMVKTLTDLLDGDEFMAEDEYYSIVNQVFEEYAQVMEELKEKDEDEEADNTPR